MNIKFSIVIPIFKTEKFLEECILSVINQTYKNIEIILVNDGSPDNSEAICKKYLLEDSRVKYFYQKNQGVSVARNLGITNSTGDYIFCMDSDDSIELQFFEKVLRTLNRKDFDVLVLGDWFCKKQISLLGALPTCGILVKRDFLNRYPDVRFEEGMQPCEDGLFTHKLMALTDSIGKCAIVKYHYRHHEFSSENSINLDKILLEMPKWFEILTNFYEKYSLWYKKDHILAFIYNEPYCLRFKGMKFNNNQKKVIFDMVHNFLFKHNISINNDFFPEDFKIFIKAKSYFHYKLLSRLFFVFQKFKKKFKKLKIAYCWQCRNAGDDFNTVLLDKLKIKYKRVEYGVADTILVGSNLDNVVVLKGTNFPKINNSSINVIGTGFIEKEKGIEVAIKKLNILAVRGLLSLKRLEILKDNIIMGEPVIADPGLLASYLFPVNKDIKYDLGIIPHYNDKGSPSFNNIKLDRYNFKVIDIQKNCQEVFKEINECRCIVSTSLHGLIFADSYDVPNCQIMMSDNVYGNNYKFMDYYSSYNEEYQEPIDLRRTIITDDIVDKIINNYNSRKDLIYLKQIELVGILKNIYK